MTATASPPLSSTTRTPQRREKRLPAFSDHASPNSSRNVLGHYIDRVGRAHEIVSRAGAGGSVLVVDRDSLTLGDRRLVAHLASDEPAENARIICEQYLADRGGRWCRSVTTDDLDLVPYVTDDSLYTTEAPVVADEGEPTQTDPLMDRHERFYRLELVGTRMSIPEMRWQQYPPDGQAGPVRVISARDVIAALESYEPVRCLTHGVLTRYKRDPKISVSVLRGELERVCASRIVLNRGLREAVLATAEAKHLSMSEIAMRCGRVKYDSRGNVSGETSWLSRRLGLAPEGGEAHPTPWVHSEVLALIARRGLGISPREVELG
jgi:hypothetical protein